ncbi:MAG: hypothetical protein ABIX01_24200 [Chitinophagaceae bacterium]
MRKLFPAIVFILLGTVCKKPTIAPLPLSGIWVEKSLRMDTLDFETQNQGVFSGPTIFLRSSPYSDPVLNPAYPTNHSSIYQYNLVGDTLHLKNFVSSSSLFVPFHCVLSAGSNELRIDKFYNRRSLAAVVLFEKVR